ncbi:MAG: arylesterase [Hyphomicrobiaceae bacterium]|nr:arylesterase [Hyphomicrobiaceae bacterium]
MIETASPARAGNMVLRALLCNAVLAVLLPLLLLAAPAAARAAEPVRIVVLGDSLVAGFNISTAEAFPAQLERALKAKGHNVVVINAGVSGDTTAGGLERLQWSVPERTDAVILELGANDALRGLDPGRARSNLEAIIKTLQGAGTEVLLAGMAAPRNLGEGYVKAFDAIYPDLAAKYGLLLYPFFLDGIVMNPSYNLADGMHPNPKGVSRIVERILPKVEELMAKVSARKAANPKG